MAQPHQSTQLANFGIYPHACRYSSEESLLAELARVCKLQNPLSPTERKLSDALNGIGQNTKDFLALDPSRRQEHLFGIQETQQMLVFTGPVALMRTYRDGLGKPSVEGVVVGAGMVLRKERPVSGDNHILAVDRERQLLGEPSLKIFGLPTSTFQRTREMSEFIVLNPHDPQKLEREKHGDDEAFNEFEQRRLSGQKIVTFPGCDLPAILKGNVLRIGNSPEDAVYVIIPPSTQVQASHQTQDSLGVGLHRDALSTDTFMPLELARDTRARHIQTEIEKFGGEGMTTNIFSTAASHISVGLSAKVGICMVVHFEGANLKEQISSSFCRTMLEKHSLEAANLEFLEKTRPLPSFMAPMPGRVERPDRLLVKYQAPNLRGLAACIDALDDTIAELSRAKET